MDEEFRNIIDELRKLKNTEEKVPLTTQILNFAKKYKDDQDGYKQLVALVNKTDKIEMTPEHTKKFFDNICNLVEKMGPAAVTMEGKSILKEKGGGGKQRGGNIALVLLILACVIAFFQLTAGWLPVPVDGSGRAGWGGKKHKTSKKKKKKRRKSKRRKSKKK
jgi:hypothetical protein